MSKLIFDVGINDADYNVTIVEELEPVNGKRRQKEVWRCPYYSAWKNILTRCYSEKEHARLPTYIGCEICDEWKYFSNFKRWMEKQDWENKSLDKDLLLDDNKIYSPDTCLYIDNGLNSFLAKPRHGGGEYIGSIFDKRSGKYIARISRNRKLKHLGTFENPFDAHRRWQCEKIKIFNEYIEEYKHDLRIKNSLIRKRDMIINDFENYKPTKRE